MDGILSDGRVGRLWLCNKREGHALGLVLRRKMGWHFVDQLLVFREAVMVNGDETVCLPDVRTLGYADGTMHDIECSVCEARRTWYIGEAALERFVEARRRRANG